MTTITVLMLFVALTSVTCQTFQYSRGWINGKRADQSTRRHDNEISRNLEKVLTPCQITKLKYLLEGKRLGESDNLFVPCDYVEDDDQPKRYKNEHGPDLFDAFQ